MPSSSSAQRIGATARPVMDNGSLVQPEARDFCAELELGTTARTARPTLRFGSSRIGVGDKLALFGWVS